MKILGNLWLFWIMSAIFVYNNYWIIFNVSYIMLNCRHKKINRVYALPCRGLQYWESGEQLKNIQSIMYVLHYKLVQALWEQGEKRQF